VMRKAANILIVILLALWSATAVMCMDADIQTASCTLLFIQDCLQASSISASLMAFVGIALLVLYHRLVWKPYVWLTRERFHGLLISVPLSFVLALSPAYRQGDETLLSFTQPLHLLFLAFKLLGFIPLFFALYRELLIFLQSRRFLSLFHAPNLAPDQAALCKKFLLFWAALFLCWTPFWIARFPGVVSDDAGRALQQYFYETVRTADHPYGYTLLIGSVIQLGMLIHSGNLGVALFIALQMAFLSGVFAFTLRDMAEAGCSAWARGIVFCFYALLPVIASYVGVIIKDVMFSAAFVGYILVLSRAVLKRDEARSKNKWWISFLVFSCLVLLLRQNGKMVVYPTTIFLLVYFWKHVPWKKRALHSALLLLPVLIALVFQQFIVKPALIAVDSTADILGVPLQQTVRILRDHEESVTDQDIEAIDALYQYDLLTDAYRPGITDYTRIKYRYFDSVSLQAKLDFLGVWAKLSLKHPLTAFHAFWALSSGYFDPTADGSVYGTTTIAESSSKYPAAVGPTQPEVLRSLRDRFFALEAIWRKLPFVKQLNNVGLYPWLLLLGFLLLRRVPERRARWIYLPYLFIFIGCLLAPGFTQCTRYAFPLVYGAPYVLTLTGAVLARRTENRKTD